MERQNQAEDLSGPMKMIFNYNNIFFSFFYDDTSGCIHRSREYAMNYVYSGEMLLDNGKEQIHVNTKPRLIPLNWLRTSSNCPKPPSSPASSPP